MLWKQNKHSTKLIGGGATGEMVQQLKEIATFSEVPSLVPSTHIWLLKFL